MLFLLASNINIEKVSVIIIPTPCMGSIFSLQKKKNCTGEFSCGAAGKESGIVTVAAWGAAVT